MCEICKFREHKGLNLLEGDFKRLELKEIVTHQDKFNAREFLKKVETISKGLKYKDFNVGEAVFSPYISKTRERQFTSDTDQSVLRTLAENSIVTYEAIKRFSQENKINKIALFNGRWDWYRATMAAGKSVKIEIEVFEFYRSGGYYENFGDKLPHNIKNKWKLIEDHWKSNVNIEEKKRIAADFFTKKKSGAALIDKSYTSDQIKGKIPAAYDEKKKTFVLFNSSDDEFAAVGEEFDNPFFKDQLDGIIYLVEYFRNKQDAQLLIRMHPNLKGLVRDFLLPLYDLENKYSNVILIKPEEDVDSYELMNIADTVISFGSTAGLEAAYWGKPVVLLGKCFYFYIGIAYVPQSKEDIPALLEQDLSSLPRLNAEKFGYYFLTGGTKATYYENKTNKEILFKGHSLNKLPFWFKIYYRFLKKMRIKNKKYGKS